MLPDTAPASDGKIHDGPRVSGLQLSPISSPRLLLLLLPCCCCWCWWWHVSVQSGLQHRLQLLRPVSILLAGARECHQQEYKQEVHPHVTIFLHSVLSLSSVRVLQPGHNSNHVQDCYNVHTQDLYCYVSHLPCLPWTCPLCL